MYALAPMHYCMVYGCTNCTIVVGAVGRMIRLEKCEDVRLIVACKRISGEPMPWAACKSPPANYLLTWRLSTSTAPHADTLAAASTPSTPADCDEA